MNRFVVGLCGCLLTASVSALTVIYDSGTTVPISPYLSKRVQSDAKAPRPSQPVDLPVTSPSMAVGNVEKTEKPLPYLKQPLFLVGSDVRSQRWLQIHKQKLIELGAIGMLVEVDSVSDIQRMAELADGLRIFPASADQIASLLGLTHYPVLISSQGWEQ